MFFSFKYMKLDFLRQSESIYFCNHRKCYKCYLALYISLVTFSTSKNTCDQHSSKFNKNHLIP